ncbi:glycosyltransferase family 4 protein [Chitinispirillales bacterium ANBcel5]|uniref:glycosyltransferase family 4 protein n=1 Tax=Cellulosispirillum alkaliphilum TaxID=3039283 RepID=UPI002A52627A|nr:glycosyltransferase family 4 protein [Chitinispirillales bacterium ANBcel5]
MKIAIISRYLPSDEPNGVSIQVHNLAQTLVQKGHDVICYSFSPAVRGMLYKHVQLKWKWKNRLFRKFEPAFAFKKIDVKSFDIVHYHGDDYLKAGATNRVRTFYGSAIREAMHARTCVTFFYQFTFYLLEIVSAFRKGVTVGISRDTVKCIPLIKKEIPCMIPHNYHRGARNITTHPTVLFIGAMGTRKRGNLMVEVFKNEILPQVKNCKLIIVGAQGRSDEHITYKGRITDKQLREEYSKAWVYCCCSSYEGFGVPVIEAMANKCPVVATYNPGADQVITSGYNGLLCTSGNLGINILTVLSDSALRSRLSENAFKTVEKYSCKKIVSRYEKVYNDVLKLKA